MKTAKRIVIVLLIILVVILAGAVLFLGPLVKTAVEKGAPPMLGVPVTLDKPGINLLAGNINLKNLVVGNPEGYKTDYAFKLGQFKIDMDMGTLGSDTMVIKDILIDGPEIIWEAGLGNSNIGTILDNLKKKQPAEKAEEEKEEPEKEEKEGGTKVQIDSLVISNIKLKFSAKLMGGHAATIPLPDIRLKDIGKEEEGGASIVDVLSKVMGAIADAAGAAIAGSAGLAVDGVKATGKLAAEGAGAAVEGAAAAGGLAVDGAKATGELAVDGARAVGEGVGAAAGAAAEGVKAVGEGAGALIKGVGGLIPGGKDKKD